LWLYLQVLAKFNYEEKLDFSKIEYWEFMPEADCAQGYVQGLWKVLIYI